MKKLAFTSAMAVLTLFMVSCVSSGKTGLAKHERKMHPRRNETTDEVWQKQMTQLLRDNKEKRNLELEEAKLKHQEQTAYELLPARKRARRSYNNPPFDHH